MKKMHIKSVVNSDIEGYSSTDTYGEYNEEDNIIRYVDNNVNVCVIIGKKITFERKCNNYDMALIFEEGKTNNSIYKIFDPEMVLDLVVQTKFLRRENNGFYIEYNLNIGKEDAGNFSVDFKWEE